MTALTLGTDTLEFAFVYTRHGARVFHNEDEMGLFNDDLHEFRVGPEMLTQTGMRQRYLKGRYNRVRFSNFLSDEFVPGEVYL